MTFVLQSTLDITIVVCLYEDQNNCIYDVFSDYNGNAFRLQNRCVLAYVLLATLLCTTMAGMFGEPACIATCQRRKLICVKSNGYCAEVTERYALNKCIRETPCAPTFQQCCIACYPAVLRYLFGDDPDTK